jgi:hypothetical protein
VSKSKRGQQDSMPITAQFGPCPECGVKESKIIEGKAGESFKMVCLDGHHWTYNFPKEKPRDPKISPAGWELGKLAREAVLQASYFVAGVRKCDLCKGTAHKDECALGKIERLLEKWGHPIDFNEARKEEVKGQ